MKHKWYGTEKSNIFRFIWSLAPGSFLELILWGIVNCIITVAGIWATKRVLALVYGGYSRDMFFSLLVYGVLLILSAGYSVWYQRYRVQFHVIIDFERRVREKLHEKSRRLSNETYETAAANAMIRMADGARQNLFRYVEIWVSIAMAILQAFAVAVYVSTFQIWFLLLLPFAVIPPCLTLVYQAELWKKDHQAVEQCKWEEAEYFKGITDEAACKESRVTFASDLLTKKWRESRGLRDALEKKRVSKLFRIKVLLTPFELLGSSGGYFLSVILLFSGKVDYAGCTAAIAAYASLMSAFHSLAEWTGHEVQYRRMIQPFFQYWEQPERTGKKQGCTFDKTIRLEHVSFQYPGQQQNALEDVCLTIHKGEVVAVVGENGAGKTTLTNLILGLFLPTEGSVFYDDEDISVFCEGDVHRRQSVVSQVFNRYKMTVEENIAIGEFGKRDREGLAAAYQAFVNDHKLSPSTLLGKEFGGTELSGGQWQQLSCARGFYKNADFLVLDEATSAIDPFREKAMYETFKRELAGKTGILITHRLGAVSIADRVIVLAHGRIVQAGTHRQLLKEDGPYLKLWNTQAEAFEG